MYVPVCDVFVLSAAVFLLIGWAVGASMRSPLEDALSTGLDINYSYGLAIVAWCVQLIATVLLVLEKPTGAAAAAAMVGV
jgi:hypothetical protein